MQLRSGRHLASGPTLTIRINNRLKTPKVIYTKQVSNMILDSFSAFIDLLRQLLARDNIELELTESLRDYFDADVDPRYVCTFIKKGWTTEKGIRRWRQLKITW